jgi:hypothetical protein
MYRSICILIAFVVICGCSSNPKNEITFKEISIDYSTYIGDKVELQVIAIEAGNYFNWYFTGKDSYYYSVRVTDGTEKVYAYFPKTLFSDRKEEIIAFDETKITITAFIAPGASWSPERYSECLLEVASFEKGW